MMKPFFILIATFTAIISYGQKTLYSFYEYPKGDGFLDSLGNVVVKPQFEDTGFFNEGFCSVRDSKSGKWGFINGNGELVIPFLYYEVEDFRNGFSVVKLKQPGDKLDVDGTFLSYKGIIDKNGIVVLPIEYNWISPIGPNHCFVSKGEEKWIFSLREGILYEIDFQVGAIYGNHLATVYKNYGDKKALYDLDKNRIITPFQYDWISAFRNDLAKFKIDSQYGVINQSGEEVTKVRFDKEIFPVNMEMLAVYSGDTIDFVSLDGKMCFFEVPGKEVLQVYGQYIKISIGSNVCIIDLKGNVVIPSIYDNIKFVNDNLFILLKGSKQALINNKGEIILDFYYDTLICPEGRSLINFWKFRGQNKSISKNQMGYINYKGEVVYMHEYQ